MGIRMRFKKFPNKIPKTDKPFIFISYGKLYIGERTTDLFEEEIHYEIYGHSGEPTKYYTERSMLTQSELGMPIIEQWFYLPKYDGNIDIFSYIADKAEFSDEPWTPSTTGYEWDNQLLYDNLTKKRKHYEYFKIENTKWYKKVWNAIKSIFDPCSKI